MEDFIGEVEPFCVFCGEKTQFAKPPAELRTRIGARRRLAGRCAECGHEISCFLPSEDGPTVHSVRVGESVWRELQRASALLEISQRAIVENVLSEHLDTFVEDELLDMERAGLIRRGERARRQRDLSQPIELWTRPRPKQEDLKDPWPLVRWLKKFLS